MVDASTAPIDFDKPAIVVAATATGTAAIIVFAVLPVLTGAMADRYALDDMQAGLVATSYFSAYALVALTSSAWIRRWNWRQAKLTGFLCMLAGLGFCLVSPVFSAACFALALVGAGAALLFPISLTLVSDMNHIDRTYAIKTSVEQLIPAGLLIALSSAYAGGFGQMELLLSLIVLIGICLLASSSLPASGRQDSTAATAHNGSALLSTLSLVALAVNFTGFAGLWAFFERLAVERSFDAAFINTWLAVGLIMSGVGPLGAAALQDRIGRVWPLIGATGVALASLLLLTKDITHTDYSLVLTVLPLGFYFAITYMLSVIAAADHNGRMTGQIAFALAVGAAAGPALYGALKSADGNAVMSMAALIGSGAALMIWIAHRTQTSRTAIHPSPDQGNIE